MLADPAFCDLAWHIGRASLGADDKQIWHLTKIYWCVMSGAKSLRARLTTGVSRRMSD